MSYVYLNDQFVLEEQATIPIKDRGFLFGDGVFTTIKVESGKPIWLAEHLAKLQEQATYFGITVPQFQKSIVYELIERNQIEEGRFKIIVTGGDTKQLGLPKREGRLVMMTGPMPSYPQKLKLKVMHAPLFPGKILAYMPRLFLASQAKPFDDCLLLNEKGEILETAFGNLYWLLDGEIYTPDPKYLPIYFGVSMERMQKEKVVHRVCTTLENLPKRAKIFRVNSLSHVEVASFSCP